jgi:hypothetical protein
MSISVSLIQPNWAQGSGNYLSYWLPYSVASVWVYADSLAEFQNRIKLNRIVFRRENTDQLAQQLATDQILVFSNYIWNWQYNLTLARKIKQINPEVQIVFGGPQVSEHRLINQMLQHPKVDVWIVSEGELSFAEYLRDYFAGSIKPRYGLNRLTDLNIPSVYQSGIFDQLIQQNPDLNWSTTLETNRGCPFKCSFCDWGSLTYDRVHRFPEHRVAADIDWIGRNGIQYVFVADANFGMFPERDMRIAELMTAAQEKYGYPEVWNANWHKNSRQNVLPIVQHLTQGGRNRAMTVSVQSMSPDVQTAIERRNMDTSHLSQMMELINQQSLSSYTELILPLPLETAVSWRAGLAQVLNIGQHNSIEIWFHQLLENAQSSQSHLSQYQFDTRTLTGYVSGVPEPGDDTPAELTDVVVATSTMSYAEFIECWQYSSMIICFHCGGWTQLLSRVVCKTDAEYLQFYDRLFDQLNSDTGVLGLSWRIQAANLNEFLNGSAPQGFSGHTFLWNFNRILHENSEQVWKFLDNITDNSDLFRAQQAFVHEYSDNYPKIIQLNLNYPDIIQNKSANLIPGDYQYAVNVSCAAHSQTQHLDWLYYRRRAGYGKTQFKQIT